MADHNNSKTINLIELVSNVLFRFNEFTENHLEEKRPPYYLLMVYMLGLVNMFFMIDMYDILGIDTFSGNRLYIFIGTLVLGLLIGVIVLIFNGIILHILVKMNGGKGGLKQSTNLALYAGLPAYLVLIPFVILRFVEDGWVSDSLEITSWQVVLRILLIEISSIYSLVLCYKGCLASEPFGHNWTKS